MAIGRSVVWRVVLVVVVAARWRLVALSRASGRQIEVVVVFVSYLMAIGRSVVWRVVLVVVVGRPYGLCVAGGCRWCWWCWWWWWAGLTAFALRAAAVGVGGVVVVVGGGGGGLKNGAPLYNCKPQRRVCLHL